MTVKLYQVSNQTHPTQDKKKLIIFFLVYTADVFLNNRINGHSPSHISYGSSDNTSVEFNTEHSSPEAVNINVRV